MPAKNIFNEMDSPSKDWKINLVTEIFYKGSAKIFLKGKKNHTAWKIKEPSLSNRLVKKK